MSLEIKSKFKPTGDQPAAIKDLLKGLKTGSKHQVLLGATGTGKTFTLANVIEKANKPTLLISHNKTLAAQLAAELQGFFPTAAVHYFVSYFDYYQPEAYMPQTDTFIEKESQVNEEIDRLRHASAQAVLSRPDVIIVASVSCIYGLGSPSRYANERLTYTKGQKIGLHDVLRQLVNLQFERNDFELGRGMFRVRGDVLEILPTFSVDEVFRISFYGDEIETIEQRNILTGEKICDMDTVSIFPAKLYLPPDDRRKEIVKKIKSDLVKRVKVLTKENRLVEAQRLEQRTTYDMEMIETAGYCQGIENYSRYFDERNEGEPPNTLIDFFRYAYEDDFLICIDESHQTIPQIGAMYAGDRSRKEKLVEYGFRLPAALDNRPLNFSEFEERIPHAIHLSATPGKYELEKINLDKESIRDVLKESKPTPQLAQQIIRPTGLLDPTVEIKPSEGQVDDLLEQIKIRTEKKERVLITTLTKRMAEDLTEYLQEANIKVQYLHSDVDTMDRINILRQLRLGEFDVLVGINLLREGLDLPEVSLIGILDADKEGFLRSETAFVQIIGRAARNENGHVIMYADKVTGSMQRAIDETSRRRKIQSTYNKKNNITPKTILKEVQESTFAGAKHKSGVEIDETLTAKQLENILERLTDEMELSAQNLDFEKAAELRDQVSALDKRWKKVKKSKR